MTHLLRLLSPPTYWRCEPGWSWRARPLPDHLLWYVLDGVGELRVAGARHPLESGAFVVFRPGDEPVAGHDPRRRLLVFGMHFAAGDGEVPPARWCRLRDRELAAALARRCEEAHRRDDPLGRRHARLCLAELLCLAWEDATVPPPDPGDAVLAEITAALRQDPSRRWTVAELAARASLSRAQFTRRFTAHAGMPPAAYQIRARIERARQLLTETALPVAAVAATLGYPDVSAFSRQYRRVTGHPPGRARAAARPAGRTG